MMHQYRDEAAFSRALLRSWENKKLGYKAQRIESCLTGRGIPDLFVETPDYSYWIELKREKTMLLSAYAPVHIGWRDGQQTWMLEKYRASGRKRPCFTLIAFNDCIAAIPMTRRYKDDLIMRADASHIWTSIGAVIL